MTLCYEKRYESTSFLTGDSSSEFFMIIKTETRRQSHLSLLFHFSITQLACVFYSERAKPFMHVISDSMAKGYADGYVGLLSPRKRRFTVEINHSFLRNKSLKAKSFHVLTFVHHTNYCCEMSVIIRGP